MKKQTLKAIIHASELLTGRGVRTRDGRRVREEDLDRIEDGALVYSEKKPGVPDRIEWVGATRDLPKKYKNLPKVDLKNERALIPGMVECHTHLVFSGDRSDEFAARCEGASYQEIAERGGGIISTVKATRKASEKILEKLATQRIEQIAAFGVRTIEIKTGYDLTEAGEIKLLKVIRALQKKFPALTIIPTYMGAHAVPEGKTREQYTQEIVTKTLPKLGKNGLAQQCDIFVDQGYFTLEDARRVLTEARKQGMKIKLHADELVNTESAALAVELGALSADHLLRVSERGIKELASSHTVAVLLPATAFYLKAEHAPARKLIDAGAAVALSTDYNPGTSMCLSLPVVMTIAALYLKMSRAEIFAAVTYNAAKALGLADRKGCLEVGKDADFAILPFSKFEAAYYQFAWSPSPFFDRGSSGGKYNKKKIPSRGRSSRR